MNSPLLNNYIQYLTRKGQVKTKSVTFVKNDINTTFEVSGIIEEYFILAVFENNIKKSGIGFENIDNIDMLAFINSNFFDINLIPQNQFLSAEQVVIMSYDNEYINTKSNVIFPDVQKVQNVAPDYRSIFFRDYNPSPTIDNYVVDSFVKQIIIPPDFIKESSTFFLDLMSTQNNYVLASGSAYLNLYLTDDLNNIKKVSLYSFNFSPNIPKTNTSASLFSYSNNNFKNLVSPAISYFTLDTTKPIYLTMLLSTSVNILGSFSLRSITLSRG